jgi:hypothetical protein
MSNANGTPLFDHVPQSPIEPEDQQKKKRRCLTILERNELLTFLQERRETLEHLGTIKLHRVCSQSLAFEMTESQIEYMRNALGWRKLKVYGKQTEGGHDDKRHTRELFGRIGKLEKRVDEVVLSQAERIETLERRVWELEHKLDGLRTDLGG